MFRLLLLGYLALCAAACASGCANDQEARAQWREALKDAHGDNMQMGSRPNYKGLYD